jgi:uncharacterized membrane protein YjgN (DUF898 family)
VEPFEFTGSAREHFGIWVFNSLLTIVTLGVYSAWAGRGGSGGVRRRSAAGR